MKIIVFDDDPTGSQTVNDCLLLLKWDYKTLLKGLKHNSNILFILANTRALSEFQAKERLKEICESLLNVFHREGYRKEDFIFVSRGDSTLRGHNYIEPNQLNKLLGPFDATFHIPAFIEGNRVTIGGEHFVDNVPAHMTIYSKDKIFGYETNNIKKILCQKSNNKLGFRNINNLFLSDLDLLEIKRSNNIYRRILSFKNNSQVIVDANDYKYLEKLSSFIHSAKEEKRFLFRTSASFLTALSGKNRKSKDYKFFSNLRRKNKEDQFLKGLIVVGSVVDNTNIQLEKLLDNNSLISIELNVEEFHRIISLQESESDLLNLKTLLKDKIRACLRGSYTPVLYTSRRQIFFDNYDEQIYFYNSLSKFMAELIGLLSHEIGYLISKGGITSNTILSHGLNSDIVYLQGQIINGVSIVEAKIVDEKHILPVVTFPGNIGNEYSLLKVWKILEGLQ